MELKKLTQDFTEIFGVLEEFSIEKITNENCDKYLKLINGDLETDYLQAMWQFYRADREGKKQDFTPKTLGKLVCEITKSDNEDWVYDICCGSGALTIQKWCSNKELKFVCEELDTELIPFLLFNLKVRNITGYVVNADVIKGVHKKIYKLTSSDKFSNIEEIEEFTYPIFTTGISNPPFNIKGDYNGCFKVKNYNYVFVQKLLERVSGKVAVILPCGVLSSSDELSARNYFEETKQIKAVITNPDKMFASTGIPTTTLLFEKSDTITFIDTTNNHATQERKQNGEDHTKNRVYKKTFNIFTDENINKIKQAVENKETTIGFSFTEETTILENWMPKQKVGFEEEKVYTRPYRDIVADLARVGEQRNINKLTINETWAKEIGMFELVEMQEQGNELIADINETIQNVLGIEKTLPKQDFIRTTKSKELKFENKNKEELSRTVVSLLQTWKVMLQFLNDEENRLLVELRDKLLPDLMENKIKVDDI